MRHSMDGRRSKLTKSGRERRHLEWLAWLVLGAIGFVPLVDLFADSAAGGPPRSAAALLRMLGRATGALAEGLLVTSVVLGLRSTVIERTFGPLDRVIRTHHRIGVIAYVAALAHPAWLAGADAMSSWQASARSLFAIDRLSIALGWGSIALLALVACSSFVTRLQHETRRRVHKLGWLVPVGAIFHAIASRGLRWVDAMLFAVLAAAAAETLRTVLSTARYRVTRTTRIGSELLEVQLEQLSRSLRFNPGQFVFVRFYDPRVRWRCREYHPFTLTSSPAEVGLRVIIKARGDCSRVLLDLEQGAMAEVRGPFGRLFLEPAPERQVWLAGGIGLAPFLSAARALEADTPRIDLFYAAKRGVDAAHLDELRAIAMRHPSLHVHCHVDEEEGMLNAERVLSDAGEGGREVEFFIAGPLSFAAALRERLVANRVESKRIHYESFEYL